MGEAENPKELTIQRGKLKAHPRCSKLAEEGNHVLPALAALTEAPGGPGAGERWGSDGERWGAMGSDGEASDDPTALPVTSLTTMTPFAGQKSAHQVPRQ